MRPQFRKQLQERLRVAAPDARLEAVIERLRHIRHARLAHINRRPEGLSRPLDPVPLEDVCAIAQALGLYFNAMTFGPKQNFVIMQFYSSPGKWYEGDLGYVLEQVALASEWMMPDSQIPGLWPKLQEEIPPQALQKINDLRQKHGKTPLQ